MQASHDVICMRFKLVNSPNCQAETHKSMHILDFFTQMYSQKENVQCIYLLIYAYQLGNPGVYQCEPHADDIMVNLAFLIIVYDAIEVMLFVKSSDRWVQLKCMKCPLARRLVKQKSHLIAGFWRITCWSVST